jgi:hypothetical protein
MNLTEPARDEEVHGVPLSREGPVDELVEAYVERRKTCARVSDAYRSRASETGSCGRVRFGLYMASLDEKELAGRDF